MYIDYDFPNWNKYIEAERSNKYWASNMKKQEKECVKLLCRNMKPIENYPVTIQVTKYVKNRNTDVDNIRIKGLLDGLVAAGILKNDSLKYIKKVVLQAEVSNTKTGIELEIIEE